MYQTNPASTDSGLTPPARRRPHLLVFLSLILLLLFAALVMHQINSKHPRVTSDEDLLRQLAKAEFLEETLPAGASVQEWPQWRGLLRDGVARTGPLLQKWPTQGLEQLWRIEGGASYSSFAVAGGRFYTQLVSEESNKQVILCLDAASGEEVWRESYARPQVNPEYGNWPRSTPVVDGDQVFIVDQACRLQCRNAETGRLLWEHDLLKEYGGQMPKWGVAFSPLVLGNLVYTSPGGADGNSVVAFDRKTGKEVWKALNDPPGYSSPISIRVAGLQQVVFFTGDSLVGLTAREGRLLWRFPWPTDFLVNAATPLAFRTSSAKEEQQYVFISSGYGKGCALLLIEADNQGGFTARRVFESNELCCHFSSPVRSKDHVFGFNESELVCLSLRDGEVKWKQRGYKKGTLLLAEPSSGAPMLVVLGEEGKLALIKATPQDEPRPTAETRPLRRRCWPMPVLAEGKLYLRDEQQILCLMMPLRQ